MYKSSTNKSYLKKKIVEKSFFVAEKKILEKWVKNRVSHR